MRSQSCLEEKVPGRTVLLPLLPFLFSTDSVVEAWPLLGDWPSPVGLVCVARAVLDLLPFPSGLESLAPRRPPHLISFFKQLSLSHIFFSLQEGFHNNVILPHCDL